jgi:hypothetical protein
MQLVAQRTFRALYRTPWRLRAEILHPRSTGQPKAHHQTGTGPRGVGGEGIGAGNLAVLAAQGAAVTARDDLGPPGAGFECRMR